MNLTGNVQDVLSDMATIAPMLETLGYNPNDTHPSYEKVPLLIFLKVFDLTFTFTFTFVDFLESV